MSTCMILTHSNRGVNPHQKISFRNASLTCVRARHARYRRTRPESKSRCRELLVLEQVPGESDRVWIGWEPPDPLARKTPDVAPACNRGTTVSKSRCYLLCPVCETLRLSIQPNLATNPRQPLSSTKYQYNINNYPWVLTGPCLDYRLVYERGQLDYPLTLFDNLGFWVSGKC